jgi:hypothetical protein
MKIRIILYSFFLAGIILISGCGNENKELKKEAKEIADVMCKSMVAMKNLRSADPADSTLVEKLQVEYQIVESEMSKLYQDFRTKYGEKTASKEFSEQFRKYLNEAMLDCQSLSKEDREAFEKGAK